MPTCTFEHNGAKVTVREEIGRDALDSPWLIHDLVTHITEEAGINRSELPDLAWGRVSWVINALLRSAVEGEVGIPWPESVDTVNDEEVFATYQAFMDAPAELVKKWREAMRKSNLEIPDPEDSPAAQK